MKPIDACSNPQPLDYTSLRPNGDSAPRLWVLSALLFVQLIGILSGREIWFTFFRGKDPQVELAWANFVGIVVLTVLCVIFRKRLSRIRILDSLLAFLLGVLSSIAGMGWGIMNGYGG